MRAHERVVNFSLLGLTLAPLFVKFFSKDLVNAVLTCYFFVIGIVALSYVTAILFEMRSVLMIFTIIIAKSTSIVTKTDCNDSCLKNLGMLFFSLKYISGLPMPLWSMAIFLLIVYSIFLVAAASLEFTRSQVVASIPGTFFCVWYALKKHWLANNILGIAFCIQGIEMLSLGSFKTGAILLVGLFFYDIFWVFLTPVMVSVAKSFDAPIKLIFPTSDAARPISMLGLGDIVIPGIFVALALRFDVSRGKQIRYFNSAFLGYTIGLVLTIIVMNWFQAAQPALLYIVPGVIGFLAAHCLWNGEVKSVGSRSLFFCSATFYVANFRLLEYNESQSSTEKSSSSSAEDEVTNADKKVD
ncbi:hypothetical protein ZIOFF_006964 [Zingiber officinale]|uniref:Signal peptide peptidase n=1 Tax=Zingiber officinale TaxID=94328 RepID=A0A8J5HPA7_ZINOF|nr:hypothetical protein ZIOFF_006964 [Zingiber officinale]